MATSGRRRGPVPKSDQPKPLTRALDRGLRILSIIAEDPDLPLVDIAQRSDLSPATALRLLDTLRAHDFVVQDEGGLYRVGLKAFEVGTRFLSHTRLQEVCRPILMRLTEDTDQTASLAILEEADAVYVDSGESQRSIRTATRVGTRVPAHLSASGKVLLAWLWEVRVRELLGAEPLRTMTPNSLSDVDAVLEALAEVRQDGIAYDREEFELGITCLAAPVRDREGTVVAALSVSTLTGQFSGREAALKQALQDAARDASRRMGWRAQQTGSMRADATLVD
ncbi:IclR family transcriptional regulator [Ahrensia marina]|uniref:IclR family transcriptional regulator n=1 Tax=Ahrensia marina TaxID=1514904 RepID=UPI0035D1230E